MMCYYLNVNFRDQSVNVYLHGVESFCRKINWSYITVVKQAGPSCTRLAVLKHVFCVHRENIRWPKDSSLHG